MSNTHTAANERGSMRLFCSETGNGTREAIDAPSTTMSPTRSVANDASGLGLGGKNFFEPDPDHRSQHDYLTKPWDRKVERSNTASKWTTSTALGDYSHGLSDESAMGAHCLFKPLLAAEPEAPATSPLRILKGARTAVHPSSALRRVATGGSYPSVEAAIDSFMGQFSGNSSSTRHSSGSISAQLSERAFLTAADDLSVWQDNGGMDSPQRGNSAAWNVDDLTTAHPVPSYAATSLSTEQHGAPNTMPRCAHRHSHLVAKHDGLVPQPARVPPRSRTPFDCSPPESPTSSGRGGETHPHFGTSTTSNDYDYEHVLLSLADDRDGHASVRVIQSLAIPVVVPAHHSPQMAATELNFSTSEGDPSCALASALSPALIDQNRLIWERDLALDRESKALAGQQAAIVEAEKLRAELEALKDMHGITRSETEVGSCADRKERWAQENARHQEQEVSFWEKTKAASSHRRQLGAPHYHAAGHAQCHLELSRQRQENNRLREEMGAVKAKHASQMTFLATLLSVSRT